MVKEENLQSRGHTNIKSELESLNKEDIPLKNKSQLILATIWVGINWFSNSDKLSRAPLYYEEKILWDGLWADIYYGMVVH